MSDLAKILKLEKQQEAATLSNFSTELSGSIDQLTDGPEVNNLSAAYSAGKGAWNLFYLDKVSPELLLTFQAMMGMIHIKTGTEDQTPIVPRQVKDLLFKDKFPVSAQPTLKAQ